MATSLQDHFWAAPPVTRTLVAAILVESILVHSRLLPFYWVAFVPQLSFKLWIPELWRLVTPFLLTGGGLSLIFDVYFTWTYGTGLERRSSRFTQPGDFFVYVVFCAVIILLVAGFLLGGLVFTSALFFAFIYTYSQDNRGVKAHFVVFEIPIELLPWATLAATLVLSGPDAALQQASGLIAAHLYDFLTRLYPTFQGGRNWLQTPAFVRRLFGAGAGSATVKPYGVAFRPATSSSSAGSGQQQPSRGWTSGFTSSSGSSWRGRGQGRRLGGG